MKKRISGRCRPNLSLAQPKLSSPSPSVIRPLTQNPTEPSMSSPTQLKNI